MNYQTFGSILLFAVGFILGSMYDYEGRNRWATTYKSDLVHFEENWSDGVRRECRRPIAMANFKCITTLITEEERRIRDEGEHEARQEIEDLNRANSRGP